MSDACGPSAATRIQYVADGSQTRFGFPFKVAAAEELLVFENRLPAAGYAVTGLGEDAGGEVVFAVPPPAGAALTLMRRSPLERSGHFRDGGPFRAATVNAELDRLLHLVQEARSELCLALRARPYDPEVDLELPEAGERASRLLGFDSAGRPMAYALADLPLAGEIGGHLVTASGTATARPLAERFAEVVNVRDFGAKGDGVSDDTDAFHAALQEADARGAVVHVPASPGAYVVADTLLLDGRALIGDGRGSLLRLALPSGPAIVLTGTGARLARLRLLGPGAASWPENAAEVELDGVTLDAVRIGAAAREAVIAEVDIAACRTGLVVEGGLRALLASTLRFHRDGIALRASALGPLTIAHGGIHGCSRAVHLEAAAGLDQLGIAGSEIGASGIGLLLEAPPASWRMIELRELRLEANSVVDIEARARHSVGLRGARIGGGGRQSGTAVELIAAGNCAGAPMITAEGNRAELAEVHAATLIGGSNLNLLAAGDLVVLATDADDVDDHWTLLKATRAGLVHRVITAGASTAEIELAAVAGRPLIQAGDLVRVVGRSGTAEVDTLSAAGPAADAVWLRADDHCRVLATHNANPASQIEVGGSESQLHLLPGAAGEPARIGGVELRQGALNGARMRLLTATLDPDTATSFEPAAPVGLALLFTEGSLGDPASALISYRADGLGYSTFVGSANAAGAAVLQRTELTGTTGEAGKITLSAHTDGRIYVENRTASSRTVHVQLIAAPL